MRAPSCLFFSRSQMIRGSQSTQTMKFLKRGTRVLRLSLLFTHIRRPQMSHLTKICQLRSTVFNDERLTFATPLSYHEGIARSNAAFSPRDRRESIRSPTIDASSPIVYSCDIGNE